jgi:hypothetical protein
MKSVIFLFLTEGTADDLRVALVIGSGYLVTIFLFVVTPAIAIELT